MKKLKNISILIAMLLSSSAFAETVLQLHTFSYHLDRDARLNEENYGLGLRHYDNYSHFDYITAGVFKNSEHNTSFYAGVGWETLLYKDLKGGFILGGITGYEKYDPAPLVAATLAIEPVTLVIAPYPGRKGEDVNFVFHLVFDIARFE